MVKCATHRCAHMTAGDMACAKVVGVLAQQITLEAIVDTAHTVVGSDF